MNLIALDTQLFFAINNLPHPPLLNHIFLFFSFYPIIIWIGIAAAFMIYERRHRPHVLLQLVAAGLLAGFISTVVLKQVFVRPRPDLQHGQNAVIIVPEKPALFAQSNEYSFPSGHASVAFAAAVVLAHHQKKHRLLLYLWATLTAFSRIYLGKHYPLDVIVGAALGCFVGYITLHLSHRFSNFSGRS